MNHALLVITLFIPESVTRLLFECPRWNRYRKQLDEDIPGFFRISQETYSHDQRVVFLLGGVSNDLKKLPNHPNSEGCGRNHLQLS